MKCVNEKIVASGWRKKTTATSLLLLFKLLAIAQDGNAGAPGMVA